MQPLTEVPPTRPVPSEYLARIVSDAHQRTIDLARDLGGERLFGPRLAIVNPPLWEIGHVGFFNDHFALHRLYGLPGYHFPRADALYDSARIAHATRWDLPLPDFDTTLAYLGRVRAEMLARLPDGGLASEAQSYVYQLAAFHEDMHGEAFTYTRQTLGYPAPPPNAGAPSTTGAAATDPTATAAVTAAPTTTLPAQSVPSPTASAGDASVAQTADGAGGLPGDVYVPGGTHLLGSDESVPFRFDNEKHAHPVEVAPFAIARAPVTNAEFAAFVEAGGYAEQRWWSEPGWQWRTHAGLTAPVYWRRTSGGWEVRAFDRWVALPPHQPVVHVSWFEADAYCRWAGRRLPSEAEWEVAASRMPNAAGTGLAAGKRRYPWGDAPADGSRANLDARRIGCVDVAAHPDGDSAFGCRQMLGNVWEWTSSLFGPFPGFRAELYAEYSQPWFAEGRRVLRGGAWATRGRMIHNGYRNFFTPERNDVFAGFRICALDGQPRRDRLPRR
ncbi:MAG TPA: selenoneine synthase SenA [Rhodocyclaceae bacterium]|nr:selenoneine synthase SenA [Rhodocyclaceae bacterium]